jgi:hypothetical protein
MFAERDKKQPSATPALAAKQPVKPPLTLPQTVLRPESLQGLQRSLGNQSLQTLSLETGASDGLHLQRACACGGGGASCIQEPDDWRMIQPKLVVGAPNDKYEQEADRIAEQVMHMSDSIENSRIHSATHIGYTPLNASITPLQPKVSSSPFLVNQQLASEIQSAKGRGQPIASATRNFFEHRFGRGFSNVRVHPNFQSTQMLGAQAFTTGQDIFFGQGQYQPQAITGQQLLAHELTHVVQQENASTALQRQTQALKGNNGLKMPSSPKLPRPKTMKVFYQWCEDAIERLSNMPESFETSETKCLIRKLLRPAVDDRYFNYRGAHGGDSQVALYIKNNEYHTKGKRPDEVTDSLLKEALFFFSYSHDLDHFVKEMMYLHKQIRMGREDVVSLYNLRGEEGNNTAAITFNWLYDQHKNPQSIYHCFNFTSFERIKSEFGVDTVFSDFLKWL